MILHLDDFTEKYLDFAGRSLLGYLVNVKKRFDNFYNSYLSKDKGLKKSRHPPKISLLSLHAIR